MTSYERNLPHWDPAKRTLFITWRLQGSLPKGAAGNLAYRAGRNSGRQFAAIDAELDKAWRGPLWLKEPKIADLVTKAIKHGQDALGFYDLHAFVVMANHVHVLITPHVPLKRIVNGLKGVTAREANVLLGTAGKNFWQEESFDHWVRNAAEFERVRAYIEGNPVSAGLAKRPEEWKWSSAFQVGVVGSQSMERDK